MNETAPSRPEVCEHGSLRRKCEICECHDEIASLRSENEALRAALTPFANAWDRFSFCLPKKVLSTYLDHEIADGATWGDCKKAYALQSKGGSNG